PAAQKPEPIGKEPSSPKETEPQRAPAEPQEKPRSERLREEPRVAERRPPARREPVAPEESRHEPVPSPSLAGPEAGAPTRSDREEEIIPMSRLRRTVAERLVEAQRNAALLTTFNEIDLSNVKSLREQHGEAFQQKYRVKLGFMSFFVKAAI